MKSERARKHLSMSGMHPNSPLAKDQYIVWRDVSIIQAVELAEEDMIEKAVKAFAETCEMYAGEGRCLECVKCEDCGRVKKFRQRLEKR